MKVYLYSCSFIGNEEVEIIKINSEPRFVLRGQGEYRNFYGKYLNDVKSLVFVSLCALTEEQEMKLRRELW